MPQNGISPNLIKLIGDESAENYAFVGDIAEVSKKRALHTKKLTHLLKIIFTDGANILRYPYIMATGTTTTYNSSGLTFSMTPFHYIGLLHAHAAFPISCFIDPESNKWKNKKPMPTLGSTISIGGFLVKVKRDDERQPTFEIELDVIAYLARQSTKSDSNENSMCCVCHLTNKY